MAGIDLLNIVPTVVTRDLSDKYILVAAEAKFGKTTLMSSIPKALILSFEPGLNARSGVKAQPIDKWSQMKLVIQQLSLPAVKEMYTTVCFDTITVASELCIDYVCANAGVKSLGDVPYGKLYDVYELELARTLRKIAQMGYGIVLASHIEKKPEKYKGEDIEVIQPQLDKRAFKVINTLVDVIGIGVIDYDEDGTPHRYLFSGKSPAIKAGSRFTHFPPVIPYSYKEITRALADAIEKEAEENPDGVVSERAPLPDFVLFETIQQKAKELWKTLIDRTPDNAQVILDKAETLFGRPTRLSEIDEDNQDRLEDLVAFMEKLLEAQKEEGEPEEET